MRIGIYCTNNLVYPTPPETIYASMDVAGMLADELVELGHDVTFFAPIGTKTKATLVTFGMLPFDNPQVHEKYTDGSASYHYENLMLMQAFRYMQENDFDIFHSHTRPFSIIDYAPIQRQIPTIATVHDPITDSGYNILAEYNQFTGLHLVSLSFAQREAQPEVSWAGNVYNGTNLSMWEFNESPADYLLSVGRIMPNKGVDIAVQIALKTGKQLKIIGSFYPADEAYFKEKIEPFLGEQIEYVGQLPHSETAQYFKNALAFLMPVRWSEPFGLVLIEALASGTPAIGTRNGSLPEVLIHGVTGYLVSEVENVDEYAKYVEAISKIDRKTCRKHAEKHFSVRAMTESYLKIYSEVLSHKNG